MLREKRKFLCVHYTQLNCFQKLNRLNHYLGTFSVLHNSDVPKMFPNYFILCV